MIQGMERISVLLKLYKIRESLYIDNQRDDLSTHHFEFENAVCTTYYHILGFQARLISHLWKRPGKRLIRNTVKGDDWKGWLEQVNKSDAECLLFTGLLDKEEEQTAWDKQYSQAKCQIEIQELLLEAFKYFQEKRQADRGGKQEERLLHCLTSAYEEQKNANPTRVPGTCEWFLNSNEFLDWRNAQDSRILWVSAGPGCGKSVLSRCLIDEGHLTTNILASTVCYFFFKDGQEGQTTSANALQAITHQLFVENSNPDVMKYGLPRFRAHGDQLRSMFHPLWNNLIETLEDDKTGEVICVLDALDESTSFEKRKLLDHLIDCYSGNNISKRPNVRLKFLITSRPEPDIESKFARLDGVATFLQLDGDRYSDEISKEINLVIDDQVSRVASRLGKET